MVTAPVADAGCCRRSSASSTTAGVELAEFALRKASLDEVFLALTGQHRPKRTDDDKPETGELNEEPPMTTAIPVARRRPRSARWPGLRHTLHADLAERAEDQDEHGGRCSA